MSSKFTPQYIAGSRQFRRSDSGVSTLRDGDASPGDAVALAAAVNDGTADAGEGVARAQRRIERDNGRLNALVDVRLDEAWQQVEKLRTRLQRGERLPLAGVPVAVKDHIHVAGRRVTEGSLLYRDVIAERDEPVIERLRASGAILLGTTNMSEFGCKGVTTNRVYGPTLHPMAAHLTPGGSSGGAASAIAAGLVPLALASDGGGSIRRPAAHVGVVGFKPSTGAIADPRSPSHTSVLGTMAATVADAAALFQALEGRDPRDPVSVKLPPDHSRAWSSWRLAWAPSLGLSVPVDDDVVAATEAAVARLRAHGARIKIAAPVWPSGASEEALMPIQHAGLASRFGATWRRQPQCFDPDIGLQIEAGLSLSAVELSCAHDLSLAIGSACAAFFAAGFHALLSPTTPCVAWPIERLGPARIGGVAVGPRAHAVFTPFFNHAMCPAISIPAGRGREGLPVGLQLVAPRLADHALLRLARAAAPICQA